ncbi:amidohydrolase [uncultured Bacteroides sp.]|uniref:amidohydrolase n=1 Tax=uncultured Bacteroides sp. TaxID=162156 RepID=UPI002AA7F921|nr:amidohydrolase [uncultured Bacteroides sp.]
MHSDQLKISILQTDIVWENKEENLRMLRGKLEALRGETDIAMLPEMFSTGFSMQSHSLGEPVTGKTITTLQSWAIEYNIAITGSYIAEENSKYYNRAFFFTPEGASYYYDKRHLFRMGDEYNSFSSGNKRLLIPYHGWNICLLICYDLRFPIWSRNVNNEYDLLIYVANWPASRRHVWDTLLRARALENMSYVCGVNRVGTDGNGLHYDGGSVLYSAKGERLITTPDNTECTTSAIIDLPSLLQFRNKFPVWKDADSFLLT